MTPLQAFQKMRELCEEYHLKFTNVKPQTVEGYPIDNIEKVLKALEIIKSAGFSLEFDESQNEWFLHIIARGTGVKTYDLLNEVLR